MRLALLLGFAAASLLSLPASAVACHPVPDPPPPGYYDHGCGDTTKGGAAQASTFVSIGDDFFDPATVRIQPGETVTWRWAGSSKHSVVANANQTERFRSPLQSSGSFPHTFAKPGRFTYHCEIHSNMRGAVEVGSAPFPDTGLPRLAGARARVSGSTAKVSFRLSERSRVRVALSGPSRRVITRVLGPGKRSISFRRLRRGGYRASLRPTDTAGNKGRLVKTRRFSVR